MTTQTPQDQTVANSEAMREPLRALLMNCAEAGINAFIGWLRVEVAPMAAHSSSTSEEPAPTHGAEHADDEAAREAAMLLGLPLGASVAEIRAAFRSRVKVEMASGAFHDQRGDGETDAHAQRLIAAKNLLLERARERA
jgi:hypothetical protein